MSTLATEAAEAPEAAARAIAANADAIAALVARMRARAPALVGTCARGSSDHAATYGAYVLSAFLGRPVASIGPSMVSIYGKRPALDGALVIAVSQSGQSPDVIQLVTAARAAGALVVGLVNDVTSPLAQACELVIPIGAHPERAVAATKSFLLSAVALLQLAAAWSGDPDLGEAVARAPEALDRARALAWDLEPLARAQSMYVVGRGLGLGPALEVALKLKETCRLHAEAFSAAEILHGPIALVGPGFPVIALGQDDASAPGFRDVTAKLTQLGASVIRPPALRAPAVLEALCAVQSFYLALPALAASRGLDADAPPHLSKVTATR
jgi:glucosamine--fructose-6-phosphate aminotransferase (isomerizing)